MLKGFSSAAWRVFVEGSTFFILVAFTVFHLIKEFVKRYSLLLPQKENGGLREEMPSILESLGLDPREYQIGKDKIFLRDSQHSLLQSRLHSEQVHKICILQRWIRGVLQRKHFIRQRNAAIMIQAAWRGYAVRADLELQAFAALRIQSFWRMHLARRCYLRERDRIIVLQSHVRGYLARKRHAERVQQHKELILQRNSFGSPISPRQQKSPLRSLSRSMSDPSRYKGSYSEDDSTFEEDYQTENQEMVERTENGEDENPWLPRQRSPSKVKKLSKMFVSPLPQIEATPKMHRQRSNSEPNSPEIKRHSRPPQIELQPTKPLRHAYSELSPIHSPTTPTTKSAEDIPNDLKPPTFSRKVKSSIRRRLSSKAKAGQRYSASDVLDDRSARSPPEEVEFVKSNFPGSLNRGEYGGKVKKGFLRKIARNNSLRRRSDSNLNKIKKSDMDGAATSHEDLAKALKQTKIVSCTVSQGPVQWKNTDKKYLKGSEELGELEAFLMKKVSVLNKEENKRDTIVDRVFRKALEEFHMQLIASYSVLMKGDNSYTLKYEDLMGQFEFTLNKIIKSERIIDSFPVIMGVNAFAGVLSEFITSRTLSTTKPAKHHKKPHVKKRKSSELTEYNGHKFSTTQFSIPTFCEHCGGFIWGLDKGFVCQECRFTCHKKCHAKSQNICRKGTSKSKGKTELFGGDLSCLVSNENSVPPLVERLIQDIEKRGLYTEGLYRKSPSNVAVKKLKNDICTLGIDAVNLEEFTVHVIAGVLKLFFRQLSVPVITADFYVDFIRTADLSEEKLRLQALCALVQKLPRASRSTLERLVFHLARISQHQEENLMNTNALAIIWAQCIMETPPGMSALEIMQDVAKQTKCLETLIVGQLSKIRATLNNIRALDKATDTANKRLSVLNLYEEDESLVEKDLEGEEQEKILLTQQLFELREQRVLLTEKLTSLGPGNPRLADSEEDLASDDFQTDDDLDGGEEEERREEYAITFDLPATPVQLQHLTKNRAGKPAVKRRRPTRARLRQHLLQR